MKIQNLMCLAVLSFSCMATSGVAAENKPIDFGPDIDDSKQKSLWEQRMKANGDILKQNRVRQIFLVHGTFVGEDPSGLLKVLNTIAQSDDEAHLSGIITFINEKSKQNQKALADFITHDEGNYTPDYAKILCASLKNNLCKAEDNFKWGSGDFHQARLEGAVTLVQHIAERISEKHISKEETVLLLGHSHAGQVFALLTTLLEDGKKAKQIRGFLNLSDNEKQKLENDLSVIRGVRLDFVTFGTPVRYGWGNYKFRLLPVINHRDKSTFLGIPTVKDGDYVQQWGIEGTDVIVNKQLDGILDMGTANSKVDDAGRRQPVYWTGGIVAPNKLINYPDCYHDCRGTFSLPSLSELTDNLLTYSIKNVFGHGIYTTEKAMLFNTDLIVQNLYSQQSMPGNVAK